MTANIELQRLSNMDGLTGLNNRRRFDEYALTEWRRARREHAPLALLLVDIDHFKHYNDTYGHLAGDEVLKRIGEAMQATFGRPADLPARYGGDEFVIVLPGTRANDARIIGERLRQAVHDLQIEHRDSSAGPHVTLSIGGAVAIPTKENGLHDLPTRICMRPRRRGVIKSSYSNELRVIRVIADLQPMRSMQVPRRQQPTSVALSQ
jgi:two-component system chemotaxis family response regulator WspR